MNLLCEYGSLNTHILPPCTIVISTLKIVSSVIFANWFITFYSFWNFNQLFVHGYFYVKGIYVDTSNKTIHRVYKDIASKYRWWEIPLAVGPYVFDLVYEWIHGNWSVTLCFTHFTLPVAACLQGGRLVIRAAASSLICCGGQALHDVHGFGTLRVLNSRWEPITADDSVTCEGRSQKRVVYMWKICQLDSRVETHDNSLFKTITLKVICRVICCLSLYIMNISKILVSNYWCLFGPLHSLGPAC